MPPMGADLEQRTSPDRSAGNSLKDKILADAAIERAIATSHPPEIEQRPRVPSKWMMGVSGLLLCFGCRSRDRDEME